MVTRQVDAAAPEAQVAVREAVERLIGDAWEVGVSAGDMEEDADSVVEHCLERPEILVNEGRTAFQSLR